MSRSIYTLDSIPSGNDYFVRYVIVPNMGITSLLQLKRFPNVKVLNVRNNQLTHLYDVPPTLEILYYDGNPLDTIWRNKSTSEIVRIATTYHYRLRLTLRLQFVIVLFVKKWARNAKATLYHPDNPKAKSLYIKYEKLL